MSLLELTVHCSSIPPARERKMTYLLCPRVLYDVTKGTGTPQQQPLTPAFNILTDNKPNPIRSSVKAEQYQ